MDGNYDFLQFLEKQTIEDIYSACAFTHEVKMLSAYASLCFNL